MKQVLPRLVRPAWPRGRPASCSHKARNTMEPAAEAHIGAGLYIGFKVMLPAHAQLMWC